MAMVVVGRDLRSAMRCDGLCSLAAASELQALSCRSRSPPPTSNHCSSSQQQTLGGWVVAECSKKARGLQLQARPMRAVLASSLWPDAPFSRLSRASFPFLPLIKCHCPPAFTVLNLNLMMHSFLLCHTTPVCSEANLSCVPLLKLLMLVPSLISVSPHDCAMCCFESSSHSAVRSLAHALRCVRQTDALACLGIPSVCP